MSKIHWLFGGTRSSQTIICFERKASKLRMKLLRLFTTYLNDIEIGNLPFLVRTSPSVLVSPRETRDQRESLQTDRLTDCHKCVLFFVLQFLLLELLTRLIGIRVVKQVSGQTIIRY
jgi:hypothetical protein